MTRAGRSRMIAAGLVAALTCCVAACDASNVQTGAATEVGHPDASDRPWLTDVTAEVGLDFVHASASVDDFHFPDIMAGGAALFDYDGDGDLDIYLTNGRTGQPARDALYRQQPDGRFIDVSDESGLNDSGYGMGVAIGDVDNDGDADVYLTRFGDDRLYRNNGDGTFQDITTSAGIVVGGWSSSATFFDYDRDGYLDLWVTRYVKDDPRKYCPDSAGRPNYCGPDTFPAEFDLLLHNNGNGTFEDVSERAGIRIRAAAGLGVVAEDFDGDGWPDVYVTNDGYANHLWVNLGDGTFRDDALLLGAALDMHGRAEAGMGVLAADLDNDLDLDLFMTHLANETNTFYRSRGPGRGFDDASGPSGVGTSSLVSTGFGTAALDLELDGDLDLLVANGRVSRAEPHATAVLSPHWKLFAESNGAYLNTGDGSFVVAGPELAAFSGPAEVSRALAVGDIDNDGDLDLVVANLGSPARLYRNDTPRAGHWIEVRALDPRYSRNAIGASITLLGPTAKLRRTIHRGTGYLSSSDPRAHFGIARGTAIDRAVVRWPDGSVEQFRIEGLDREVTLERGAGSPASDRIGAYAETTSRMDSPHETAGVHRRENRGIPVSSPLDADLTSVEPLVVKRIEAMREAVRTHLDSGERWGELGATYDVHALFGPAADCYRQANRLAPQDFRWAYLLAVVRDVDGATSEEVAELFAAATRLDPTYVPAWFRLGHALSLRGQLRSAREALEQTLKLDGTLAVANREMGQLALALENPVEALRYLTLAEQQSPADAAVHAALASTYTRMGRTDEALASASRANELSTVNDLGDPIYAQTVSSRGASTKHLLERAQVRLEHEKFREALDILLPLELELNRADDPLTAHAHYLAGTANARLGEFERAQKELERALAADSDQLGAHLELAALESSRGDVDAALEHYRHAQRIAPDDATALSGLAQLLTRTGDDGSAVAAYTRLAAVTALDARTLTNWGNALLRTGRLDDAIARYRDALILDGEYPNAHYNLAVALERTGEFSSALEHYRKTLTLEPEHPTAASAVRRLEG